MSLYLSIVVPAYNEEPRILRTLERLNEFLSEQNYSWEVTVIDDGSTDRTCEIVQEFSKTHDRFCLLGYKPNRGKGYAVRTGMLQAQGELILFSDADLAAPIEEVDKLLEPISRGASIAIGSRPLKESRLEIRQPWYREMCGRAFNKAVQLMAVKGIQDTQCGFKIFRRDVARDIFTRCKLDRFGFDFEALMIARDLGYSIAEIPIRWRHQEGSKVSLLRDGSKMLLDLARLRLQGKRKRLEPRA